MKFNASATIYAYAETLDDYGQPIKSWGASAVICGFLTPTAGGEKREKYGVERDQTLTFRTYWRESLTTRDRLLIGSATYEIDNIFRESNRVFMVVTLKARDGE